MTDTDNYVTGANGFVGKKLLSKLTGETVAIHHTDPWRPSGIMPPQCRNFFYLSTYGNMVGQTDSRQIFKANVLDLGIIIDDFLDGGALQSLIYVSSSSVLLPVQTSYSHTKRAGEEMVLAMPIPGCVVRPFSITGVGEQKEHLIPTLIRSCMEGTPMEFVGEPTHDYVDVEDIVRGLISLADVRACGVFELGTGIARSNLEVLQLVEKVTGKKANLRKVSKMRSYDTWDWRCKNFRARDYGWEPKKTLEQSIAEMVEAYKNQ